MRERQKHRRGFTLIEVVVVVVIAGVISAAAVPAVGTFISRQNLRSSARGAADALILARNEAMRSGVNHVVFMSIGAAGTDDPRGTAIADGQGNPVDIMVLQDDDGDCSIDAGEPMRFMNFQNGVGWGVTNAAVKAPLDGTPAMTSAFGSTFSDPTAPAAASRWVFFGPDGVPIAFEGNAGTGCGALGAIGSGNGALYVTDGDRDYSVVLTTLGGLRLHAWDTSNGAWTL